LAYSCLRRGRDDLSSFLLELVGHGLLTEYQAGRIDAGKTFGLILGNYRVLDRLGGGMGVVYRAEQASDAASVDIRADLYGLGGTLFWCLTGQTPFEPRESLVLELAARRSRPAPSARARRAGGPEVAAELDAVVARLLAPDPADRYPTPQAVMQALLPFLSQDPLP
jgi:serine/threonine protein kinase